MFFCGYTDGVEANANKPGIIDDYSDAALRKRKSIPIPTLTSSPKDVKNVVLAHGNIYFISKDRQFYNYDLRTCRTCKINMDFLKETGHDIMSVYVDPVFEELILLLEKSEFNIAQQEIMKWRPGMKAVTDDDFYSLFQLDEDEKVIEITGTDDCGVVYTSKKRVWLVEKWRSKPTDWLLTLLPWETPIIQVSCGKEHIIALTSGGSVLTMGKSTRGQLGTGSTASCSAFMVMDALEPLIFTKVVAGGWHNLVLSDSGDIYGWGWNESGQIGSCLYEPNEENNKVVTKENIPKLINPSLLDTPLDVCFTNIFAGSRHSVALATNGNIYTWGWNGYGQLGHGDLEDKLAVSLLKSFERKKVEHVICGMWGTLVLT